MHSPARKLVPRLPGSAADGSSHRPSPAVAGPAGCRMLERGALPRWLWVRNSRSFASSPPRRLGWVRPWYPWLDLARLVPRHGAADEQCDSYPPFCEGQGEKTSADSAFLLARAWRRDSLT